MYSKWRKTFLHNHLWNLVYSIFITSYTLEFAETVFLSLLCFNYLSIRRCTTHCLCSLETSYTREKFYALQFLKLKRTAYRMFGIFFALEKETGKHVGGVSWAIFYIVHGISFRNRFLLEYSFVLIFPLNLFPLQFTIDMFNLRGILCTYLWEHF